MRLEDDLMSGGVADRDLPFLSTGVILDRERSRPAGREIPSPPRQKIPVVLNVAFASPAFHSWTTSSVYRGGAAGHHPCFAGTEEQFRPGRPDAELTGARRFCEHYSHEVSSCGFWPGGGAIPYAAFYSYSYPEPAGFSAASIKPDAAFYSADLREFILPYDVVRQSKSPDETLLDFLQTTYEAAANLSRWDRRSLERGPDPRSAA
jgi:hypothetical protein